MEPGLESHAEQTAYATVLHWSTLGGFIVLIITFLAYMLGWLPAYVPLHDLPHLWNLPSGDYLKATGIPTGWSWLFLMGKGDFASLLGIAILSGCSIACIAAVMPIYAKAKNTTYIVICALEILVLILSASGIFSSH